MVARDYRDWQKYRFLNLTFRQLSAWTFLIRLEGAASRPISKGKDRK
jgi:hypothetical protein